MSHESPLVWDTLEPSKGRFEDTTVIDCDVHVTYSEGIMKAVAEKMPKPWDDYVDPDTVGKQRYSRPAPGIPKSLGGKRSSRSSPRTMQIRSTRISTRTWGSTTRSSMSSVCMIAAGTRTALLKKLVP